MQSMGIICNYLIWWWNKILQLDDLDIDPKKDATFGKLENANLDPNLDCTFCKGKKIEKKKLVFEGFKGGSMWTLIVMQIVSCINNMRMMSLDFELYKVSILIHNKILQP